MIVQFNNVNDNGSVKVTTSGCNSSEFSDTKTGSICYLGPAGTIALNGNSANPQELPCGSQPVTFTTSSVTNANNYNWNYSSLQNSGWTYVSGQGTTTLSMNSNGSSGGTINMTASRANASITATTPTLTVTRPVAGGNASGIFGDGYLCSGETKSYSINSLPIGANVTWSVSPNLSLPAGNTGNPVIIGYNYDGAGTITATINDDCGQATRSTTVQSGVFTTSQYTISGDNQVCPNGDAYVYLTSSPGYLLGYNWTYSSNWQFGYSPSGGDDYKLLAPPSGFGSAWVKLSLQNACGWSIDVRKDIFEASCFGRYVVQPNPAKDNLTIDFQEISKVEDLPEEVKLLSEKSTNPVRSINPQQKHLQQSLREGNKLDIDVKELPRGIYYLHFKNSKWVDKKEEVVRVILE